MTQPNQARAQSGAIEVGVDILNTVRDPKTKCIIAVTGDAIGRQTETDGVEIWQHNGLASRACKPNAGKAACQGVIVRRSDHDVCIATRDLRGQELAGNLDYGETCIYAAGEDGNAQARILLKKNGSINIFTKSGNTSGGTGMGLFVNPDGSISIMSHSGAAMLIGTDGSLKLFNGSGAVQIDSAGAVKISGSKVSISAPAIVLGGTVPGAVVTSLDLTALIPIIATGIGAAGPTGPAAATAFTTAATALVTALASTKRTTAD